MSRATRGLGYGMVTIPFITNLQYAVIMAYSIFYLSAGMRKVLPWSTCDSDYNTANCYSVTQVNSAAQTLHWHFLKKKRRKTNFRPKTVEKSRCSTVANVSVETSIAARMAWRTMRVSQ